MFDNVAGSEPEDMFAKVDAPQPAPPVPPSMPGMPSASAAPLPPMASSGGGFPWKGILVAGIAIVVIGAGGALSYFLLSSRTSPVPAAPAPAPVPEAAPNGALTVPPSATPIPTAPPAPEAPPTAPVPPSAPAPTPVTEADTDHDGLSDVQEAALGTDPLKADTDGDGLTDGEEVNVYHTNPLKADTDGDGFSDGQEVKNGYNPNGPGKLFQVPPAAK